MPAAPIRLEPIRASAWIVTGLHCLLAALVWWWLQRPTAPQSPPDGHAWFSPQAFAAARAPGFAESGGLPPGSTILTPSAAASAPGAAPTTAPATLNEGRTLSRHIMLRAKDPAALNGIPRSAQNELAVIETALQEAFDRVWHPPESARQLPKDRRIAVLDVALNRDGTVGDCSLSERSGSAELDVSILAAAAEVKKIPQSLPSSFPKERYECSLKFFVE